MKKREFSLIRNSEFIFRYQEDGVVVLDPTQMKLYTFNSVATRIWRFLWKPRTSREIVKKLEREFNASHHDIKEDVVSFLKEARANKLLRVFK